MSATYLQAINDVLVRLREAQVASIDETNYSTLVGKFVNDAKREVEDAYPWNVLYSDINITTSSGTYSYSMTGSGQKFRVIDAINITSQISLINITFADMNRRLNFGNSSNTIPVYYAFNGIDGSYDTKVNLFPKPDGVYNIKFTIAVPQAKLTDGATVILAPEDLIVQNAYARALVERGEDGGLTSSEAYILYRGMLADRIALESTRFPEEGQFVPI